MLRMAATNQLKNGLKTLTKSSNEEMIVKSADMAVRKLSTDLKEIPKFRYLSAWFCPFAHRCHLSLEHHRSRVDYEWVEALGWEQREDKNNVTGTGKEWW